MIDAYLRSSIAMPALETWVNHVHLQLVMIVAGVLVVGIGKALQRGYQHLRRTWRGYLPSWGVQREAEERFQATFEQAAVGMAHVGINGQWLRVNQRLCDMLGYTSDEFKALTFQDITYPPDLLADLDLMQRLRDGEIQTYTLEKRYVHQNKSLIWINLTVSLVRQASGAPKYFISIIEDISGRKRAEAALQASMQQVTHILESVSDAFIALDAEWRPTYVNQQAARLLRREQHELIGQSIWSAFLHGGRSEFAAQFRTVYETQAPVEFEAFCVSLRSWFRVRADPSAAGLSVYFRDVTERRRRDEARQFLVEATSLLNASLDYTTTLDDLARLITTRLADWCVVDMLMPNGTVQRMASATANPGQADLAEALRRYPPSLDADAGSARVLRSRKGEFYPSIRMERLASIAYNAEHLALLQELGMASVMFVPLLARGQILGAITFIRSRPDHPYDHVDFALAEDLARRASVAIDNARLYLEAQEAVHVREVFLSIAAHELKTPLTSLLGYAHVLQRRVAREAVFGEREQRTLGAVVEQGQRLNRLIEALLDLSRIQTDRLSIERQPVDLAALAQRLVAEMLPTLDQHSLHLVVPEPLIVEGDQLRLEQVLQNLLQNAIKYSPGGGPILVRIDRQASAAGPVARLSVTDHGIGIPSDAQPQLFQRFYRAGNVDPRRISGLGIGLFVVNEIVTRHGGSIHVQSQEGVGSTFTVCLPLRANSCQSV